MSSCDFNCVTVSDFGRTVRTFVVRRHCACSEGLLKIFSPGCIRIDLIERLGFNRQLAHGVYFCIAINVGVRNIVIHTDSNGDCDAIFGNAAFGFILGCFILDCAGGRDVWAAFHFCENKDRTICFNVGGVQRDTVAYTRNRFICVDCNCDGCTHVPIIGCRCFLE